MTHEDNLKMINKFFKNLTIEEFEKMAIKCCINEINSLNMIINEYDIIKKGEIDMNNFTVVLKQQLIMTIGETQNGWTLTKEVVKNSIDTFSNRPIIWNREQEFRDYSDKNIKNYKNNIVIGAILDHPNVQIYGNDVYADIVILSKYRHLWIGKFDNWCIQFNDNKSSFDLFSIEVF
jgi:hypothetical protein